MERSASAIWHGDLKQGAGSLTTQSHVLNDTPYSFHTRFEDGAGTNPEELIAAAHAGCFTMALSSQLTQRRAPAHAPSKPPPPSPWKPPTTAPPSPRSTSVPTPPSRHRKEHVRRASQESQRRLPHLAPPQVRRDHPRRDSHLRHCPTPLSLKVTNSGINCG